MVDLRLKFGLPETDYTQRTCIIVAQIDNRGTNLLIGIIVDCVSEVLTLQTTVEQLRSLVGSEK